jgi:hypothetical protein
LQDLQTCIAHGQEGHTGRKNKSRSKTQAEYNTTGGTQHIDRTQRHTGRTQHTGNTKSADRTQHTGRQVQRMARHGKEGHVYF